MHIPLPGTVPILYPCLTPIARDRICFLQEVILDYHGWVSPSSLYFSSYLPVTILLPWIPLLSQSPLKIRTLFLPHIYWGVIYTNKIHRFKMYRLINFDKGTQKCNHHHKRDTEPFHQPGKFPCAPLQANPTPPPDPTTTEPLSVFILWHFLECHMNVIKEYVVFCVWLLSLHFTNEVLWIFTHFVVWISSWFLFIAELVSITGTYCNLFIHSLVDGHFSFQFGTIPNKESTNIIYESFCVICVFSSLGFLGRSYEWNCSVIL